MTAPKLEEDPAEIEGSKRVVELLQRALEIQIEIEELTIPETGSPLDLDDKRVPTRHVSDYAHHQLTCAASCLESLKRMAVRDSDDGAEITIGPYGTYALIRNSIDALAIAIWLLQPINGTLRIKRLLMLQTDEVKKSVAFRKSMNQSYVQYREKLLTRLEEIATETGLGKFNLRKENAPSTTRILIDIEMHHSSSKVPWLSLWQLSSGHAHNKQWAVVSTHILDEIPGSKTEHAASYKMTASYQMLAAALKETVAMLEVGFDRYRELATVQHGAAR